MEAIIKINDKKTFESLVRFLNSINIDIKPKTEKKSGKEKEVKTTIIYEIPVTVPDKKADPESLFGIWKDRNITLERLRNIAWGGRA